MRQEGPAEPDEEDDPDDRPPDGRAVLRTLADRWRAADTLEYRSEAVMQHVGEQRWEVRIYARLRRPNRARLIFAGNRPESRRVRVSDGLQITDRMRGLNIAATRSPLRGGSLLADISHPLDMAGYSVDQFFSQTPFLPSGGGRITVAAARIRFAAPGGQRRPAYRVIATRGTARDTLLLDRVNFAPLRLVRWGVHGGRAQELLRETFTDFRLGPSFPPGLFVWSAQDEAGRSR